MIIVGNYFPKNHINYFVGLKFPWLFKDEEGWYKTHKLGSYTWIIAGLVLLVHPLHHITKVTTPLVIILAVAVPLVYSLALYIQRQKGYKEVMNHEIYDKTHHPKHTFVHTYACGVPRLLF